MALNCPSLPPSTQNLIANPCIAGRVCLRQTDFKQLVAYSSINHIGIVCLGLYSNTLTGIEGGILLSNSPKEDSFVLDSSLSSVILLPFTSVQATHHTQPISSACGAIEPGKKERVFSLVTNGLRKKC
ncbi:uncharacterized protein MELLADRAFT_91946 [Melampsora larici-populina 98AG31]|uniref:NADH:quinone oxidoreductase/Mrp antiporter transmembrane domain-containing protein n=1 Tax=Melampsora larici-populina (strain 98AG31 / pathotype 3-4-7) TaxID=747676 RepID=F4S0Z7_MELLP|nr:uncharacterized protein MELLADRAFT_91946 [Melampsora larici-populina 98AG31]EGG01725.1 hypothetical protein MELLADRAFT_91946 [Melampsora larici-populina 98AG31]